MSSREFFDEESSRALADASRAFAEDTFDVDRLGATVASTLAKAFDGACILHVMSDSGANILATYMHAEDPVLRANLERLMAGSSGGKSTMFVPLSVRGRTVGSVDVTRHGDGAAPFDDDDLVMLRRYAEHAGLAIANARAQTRLRQLVESVPDVLWSATHEWKYTYVSPNLVKITGYTPTEICEAPHGGPFAVVHPDDDGRVRAARKAIARLGKPMDLECRWQRRDGQWIWVHLRAVRTTEGFEGIFQDITARKQLEEQLFRAQKLDAIGRLTAGIAHDFRNILAVISVNSTYLADELAVGSETQMAARDIQHAAKRGTDVANQLLAFSRREASSPHSLDANAVLEGIERFLLQTLGKHITLVVERGQALGRIWANAGQLEQVVTNLVVNARDAMPDGGTLAIRTAETQIEGSHFVRLSVVDTGTGMDDATRARIFEPFFTTKARAGGTGLGLATCYGIVKHAGGFMTVESEVGKGTSVHVHLPVEIPLKS